MSSGLFVIVGTQRSGTTLLCKILSAHPKLFVQNETWLPGVLKPDNASSELLEPALRSFLSKKAANGAGDPAYSWLGLKDPLLTYYPEHLCALLEFGKVINIVRDPRGVVSSYIDNAWGLGTNAYTGALRWRSEVRAQLSLGADRSEKTLTLRYEDLVLDMERELRKICAFLDIPFDDVMLRYDRQRGPIRSSRESKNVFRPPDEALIKKWRATLSMRQISIIETLCDSEFEMFGYQLAGEKVIPSRIEVAWYRLHQQVVGELQIQYRMRKVRLERRFRRWRKRDSKKP